MSNPNNPFSTEENNNKNENNEQNNNKGNAEFSKILEESSSTAVPPPAYEEVVKPPPTQPGYTYQSYPPPSFPPPPVTENYNQPQPPNIFMAPVTSKRFENRGCYGCCSSNRNRTCGCGWFIVLLIFIVFGSISIINNNVCNNITLGTTPTSYLYDPIGNTTLLINVDNARIRKGEVRILQSPNLPDGNQKINIEIFTGSSGQTPKFDQSSQNGIYELKISQISGFSIFNIPPRCMKLQVNVNLPQVDATSGITPIPNTIKVRDLDVSVIKNSFKYQQKINLVSNNGDIQLSDVTAQSMNIQTNNGDVLGTLSSNELSVTTDDGDLDLILGNDQGPPNPKVLIKTDDGDVALRFQNGNSFSGNYDLRSNDGRIRILNPGNDVDNGDRVTGSVGNGGTGTLNVLTDNGDIAVAF